MLIDSGTKASDGTEQQLTEQTTDKFFQLIVSRLNQVDGETLRLRIYTKLLSGDAYETMYDETFYDAPTLSKQLVSIPIPSDISMKATLTASTGKNYKWKLLGYGTA